MRKNTDYNAFELVVALCMICPDIKEKSELSIISYESVCEKLKGCSQDTFEKYKTDILSKSDRSIKNYIEKLKKCFENNNEINLQNIKFVYLEGKNITSDKIIELNKNVNNKCAKGDIYVEFENSCDIIAISVKQNKNCTKSNYSVEKMINEYLIENKIENKINDLSKTRKEFLKNRGFETHDKDKRKQVNGLFSPGKENEYWDKMRQYLKEDLCNTHVKNKLVEYLYPSNLPYILYEFDGRELKKLKATIENSDFYEHLEYYYTKKRNLRTAAKLFYQLIINNKTYRIEIRWKGNIHSASPQFQIHVDN